MIKIDENNVIFLTRADSMDVELDLTDEKGDPFDLSQIEFAYFRLKKRVNDTEMLIEKTFVVENDELLLKLDPSDTEMLNFGDYFYEIELITTNNNHYTVIANKRFIIGEELENHG